MVFRCILPDWAKANSNLPAVVEGQFSTEQLDAYNRMGYNCYLLPNYPSVYDDSRNVTGADIDTFLFCFVDMDLKDKIYASKEAFLDALAAFPLTPTSVVDSGRGIHAYWAVSDLDSKSFLRLQRRLCRHFKTDEAVSKIYQLMRVPGTVNTKDEVAPKPCVLLSEGGPEYTCEEMARVMRPITKEDETYCERHYNQTYKIQDKELAIDEVLPAKFMRLLRESETIKELWTAQEGERSQADFRLGQLLFAEGFDRNAALSVLVNCAKAATRAPVHRMNYALNIVDKIWTEDQESATEEMSFSVADIKKRPGGTEAKRIRCWDVFDGTAHGFRRGEVMGLIGGVGSGKTTLALNFFHWFAKHHPELIHIFVALEQPKEEIAERWGKLVGDNERLNSTVHVMSNYRNDDTYRNLSLSEIEEYIVTLKEKKGVEVGCVVIDHIGVLRMEGKDGEMQGLIDVCHHMKAFAKRTNTFLLMQSQTSRAKAGIGDVELDKDAAYGTTMFEAYCDFVVTSWQPLKRMYKERPDMTCSAFKFCKIRKKNVKLDKVKEDVPYVLMFDPETELLRRMVQAEEQAFEFLNKQASTDRNKDRKRDGTVLTSIDWAKEIV